MRRSLYLVLEYSLFTVKRSHLASNNRADTWELDLVLKQLQRWSKHEHSEPEKYFLKVRQAILCH